MFQLIVAVISIALVAALAIASIFYGGDAFTKSSTKAQVTTLINQGQQIAGANSLYKTDYGVAATDIASLLTAPNGEHYLAAEPTGTKNTVGAWGISATAASIQIDAAAAGEVCDEVVKQGAGECTGTAPAQYFSFAL